MATGGLFATVRRVVDALLGREPAPRRRPSRCIGWCVPAADGHCMNCGWPIQ